MKIYLVLFLTVFTVIYTVEGVHRKKHDQNSSEGNSSDKPDEIRRIAMPPKSIKIVVSPKPTPQPLRSLYKSYVGKKPLMRKFIPIITRTTEQPIPITRRPLMKQRQFIIGAPSSKPYQKKEDLFITTKRRINFRLNTNKTEVKVKEAINKESEGRIMRSRLVPDTVKPYGDLSVLPKDAAFAESQKMYTILYPPNSNIESQSIQPDNNGKIEKNGTNTENNIKEKERPVASSPLSLAEDNSMKMQEAIDNHHNESAADQDSKEFIFIMPDSVLKSDNENKEKATEKQEVDNDLNKT